MSPLRLLAFTATTALGAGMDAQLAALREGRGGLRRCDYPRIDLATWIGRVEGVEAVVLPPALACFDCRNNRLAWLALAQDDFRAAVALARERFGAERVGVFIGTTTSGIQSTEDAYRARDPITQDLPRDFDYRHTHNGFSIADFVRTGLGLRGPAQSVLTACSSSAKVFGVAQRHIAAGLCDAALVGGSDSLCLTTLYGFNALQLVSSSPCKPWDGARDGLSLGEAAGFALLAPAAAGDTGLALLGFGESADAHHLSAPHPDGLGAVLAMRQALASAGFQPQDIDYINLHGTGTPANDAAEDKAIQAVFGDRVPCSSTKGWIGHTLGAAGIVEALFAGLAIRHRFLPGTLNTRAIDPALSAQLLLENRAARPRHAMSNSFGFGGNNCALVIGELDG
ncbi:MAG: beta-ketoacyl-[acyl-carrier-protein] synthase family protein [Gammaproteobacteria bacterium]